MSRAITLEGLAVHPFHAAAIVGVSTRFRRMSTRVLLIRHGESTWNAEKRWQGQQDPPLTDQGREQARQASLRLGVFDAIYTSTLERAMTTAVIISEQIGIGPVVAIEDLVERCAGAWEGFTQAEIEEGWPGYLKSGQRPEGFEPEESLAGRGFNALNTIADEIGDGEALAVTHSGMIYALERDLDRFRGRMSNLGGIWLTRSDGAWSLGERVDLIEAHTGEGMLE